MKPVTFNLDTVAGTNLIDTNSPCPTWEQEIKPSSVPPLRDAGGQPLNILGVFALFVRIGDIRVKVTFVVINGLVTGVLLGTSFPEKL